MTFIFNIQAQERIFEISPAIGINYAKTTGMRDGSRILLPNLGVKLSYRITNNFLVSITPSFSQRGDKVLLRNGYGAFNGDYQRLVLSYIDFPITFQRNFNFKRFTLYPIIGLQLGYMTAAKAYSSANQTLVTEDLFQTASNWGGGEMTQSFYPFDLQKFDIGLTVGVGVSYKVSSNVRIFHEVRYTHSVNKFMTELNSSYYFMQNNFYTLTNGVIFGAGKKRNLLSF